MPAVIEVRHGNELFGIFRVETAVLEMAGAGLKDGEAPEALPVLPAGAGT